MTNNCLTSSFCFLPTVYEVLGVEKGAPERDVKKGYHKIAIKNHPDKNPGESLYSIRLCVGFGLIIHRV